MNSGAASQKSNVSFFSRFDQFLHLFLDAGQNAFVVGATNIDRDETLLIETGVAQHFLEELQFGSRAQAPETMYVSGSLADSRRI